MQDLSAPKKNPSMGDGAESFCSVRDMTAAFFRRTAGKVLFVSDEGSFPEIAPAARTPRAVSAVIGRDALPLFAMPETSGVFAVGGADVMRAARLYASVRRVPCVLFPTQSELFGVFGQESVAVKDVSFGYPLAEGEVYLDERLFSDVAEGYAGLLLCRLALFERRALFLFDGGERPSEEAFGVLMGADEPSLRDVLLKNAALRRSGITGEGAYLAAEVGNFSAFDALMRLYVAFFRCGSPRKYAVPDYGARARAAGVPFAEMSVPDEETYARRALVLSGRRADLLRELSLISQKNATYCRVYRSFGGKIRTVGAEKLKYLPEKTNGLSAVIRDFGLLEKL